jgi:aerobic-type carbon monoxide dehydrogenase small subunit (CoxS/CutS family)
MASIAIIINGQEQVIEAAPDMPLLWALRDLLGLTGAKYSCGAGHCGACTVHVDGDARRACITAVADVAGKQVTTIEGLAGAGRHPVQQAWIAERVSQCGYCQPGQIMTAVALLNQTPTPSDEEIDAAMSDTLCRCGTYQRIRRAIHRAAGNRQSATTGGA